MSVSRFLACAAVSAVVWAGSWIGIGYLLTHGIAGVGWSFGISLTFVIIIVALAAGSFAGRRNGDFSCTRSSAPGPGVD